MSPALLRLQVVDAPSVARFITSRPSTNRRSNVSGDPHVRKNYANLIRLAVVATSSRVPHFFGKYHPPDPDLRARHWHLWDVENVLER